jgi:hypothetical protein
MAWGKSLTLAGPSGPSGPSGPGGSTGATGPAGPSGPSGPAGTVGTEWAADLDAGNGAYWGITVEVTAGEAIAAKQLVFFDGTHWHLAKADAAATSAGKIIGIAVEAIGNGDVGTVLLWGSMEVTGWGLTAGSPYYVSSATAGLATLTAPSTAGQSVICVGFAYSTTSLFFQTSPVWGEKT